MTKLLHLQYVNSCSQVVELWIKCLSGQVYGIQRLIICWMLFQNCFICSNVCFMWIVLQATASFCVISCSVFGSNFEMTVTPLSSQILGVKLKITLFRGVFQDSLLGILCISGFYFQGVLTFLFGHFEEYACIAYIYVYLLRISIVQ